MNQRIMGLPLSVFLMIIFIGFCNESPVFSRTLSEDETLVWVGTGAYNDGFYDIAEKQFSQFLRDYPDHAKFYDVSYLLGKTLYHQGKLKEARSCFLKIVNEHKAFDHMEYVLFWLADIELSLGNKEGARRYYLSLLTRYPKFEGLGQVHFHLGLIEVVSNRPAQAELYLKRVFLTSKSQELLQTAHFWLGFLCFKQNRLGEATEYFKKTVSGPQSISSPYLRYALLWLGDTYIKQNNFEEAKKCYQTLKERLKGDALSLEVLWKIGFCDYRIGLLKEATDAFQSFISQAKESPLVPLTQYFLSQIFLKSNDHPASIKELQQVLTRSKETPVWGVAFVSLFWNLFQQNDLPGAQKTFQRLMKLNAFDEEKAILQWFNGELFFTQGNLTDALPYYFNVLNTTYREKALFRIAKIYFFENKFREAITSIDILLLEYPNSLYTEESLFIKGECYGQLGIWNQALEAFDLLSRKERTPLWRILALTQTGNLSLFLKDHWAAERAFKKLIEEFPNHPLAIHAAFQLGKLFFKQNNILEAIHYYSMILKWDRLEWLGGTYFSLGEIFYQQGKYDKAFKSFEMALRYLQEGSPWFFLTHLEIGNLQKKNGRYEEARRSYLTIVNRTKDEELKRAATELLRLMEKR